VQDLSAWKVLVVGMGSIGRLLGSHLAELGSEVVGVGSHAHDDLHGVDELSTLLPRPTPSCCSPRSAMPRAG